jgi:pimeloyl-ACP methyl ester carboxylesterase
VEQVTIRRLGDAVALALLAGAPIRVAAAVMDAAGFDPGDRRQQRLREEQELERLRRRPPNAPTTGRPRHRATPATMARYCQARADRDADLTHLMMREVFPPDEVEAVVFRSVGRLWRVEVGIAAEESDQERERFARRTDQAVRELETLS